MGSDFVKPEIFISYTRRDPLGTKLAEELFEALNRKGFKPLRDRGRLDPGAAWQPHLDSWIQNCDAAIVFVTQGAVDDTPWVRREVTSLASRWGSALNDGRLFPLIVVCLDGARARFDADWTAALGGVNIEERSEPSNARHPGGDFPAAELDALVSWVIDKLRQQCPPLGEELCVPGDHFYVRDVYERIYESSDKLHAARQAKGGVSPNALARALLTTLVRAAFGYPRAGGAAAAEVGTMAAALEVRNIGDAVFTLDQVREMFDRLDLFLTDPEAARRLHAVFYPSATAGAKPGAVRVLTLKLSDAGCVSLHLRRAHQGVDFDVAPPRFVKTILPPDDLVKEVQVAVDELIADAHPDPVTTAVLYLDGPVPGEALDKIRAVCSAYPFPIIIVIFSAGSEDARHGDQVPTVYDEATAEQKLLQHRRDAYARLRQRPRWKAIGGDDRNRG